MTSACVEARRKRSNSFTNSHPPSMEAGLTVICSSTGEFESRNLMQSSSDLMPEMPTIFTSRSWPNRHFHWSSPQKPVCGSTSACSSGRPCMDARYQKLVVSPRSGIGYKLIRQFFLKKITMQPT